MLVGMSMKAITFQAPEDTVRAFDDAAASMSLSREEALQNLMEIYLSHDKEFRTSVAIGLQQADAGQLLEESEIEARIQSWERVSGVARAGRLKWSSAGPSTLLYV